MAHVEQFLDTIRNYQLGTAAGHKLLQASHHQAGAISLSRS
jgi:hypothetical protein